MSDCRSLIGDPFAFPRRPHNRPALPRIGYRVGAYPDFVEAMRRAIDTALPLASWTHRGADDPGIALLESAAIVGDILTFYQEHYANEAFLRTAQWRESVAELVRLLGYRLAPGLAGGATFAFEVKKPVVIPAGFPLKAELTGLPDPAEFETLGELAAWPYLSAFRLYRAREPATGIDAGEQTLQLAAVENAKPVELKQGDRLMLVPPEEDSSRTPHMVKVAKVTWRLGRVLIELEAPVSDNWSGDVRAYRLGRSFRHFGHNAPSKFVQSTPSSGTISGTTQSNTRFVRHMHHTCPATESSIPLPANFVPLDQELNDVAAGSLVIVQLKAGTSPRTVVRTIRAVSAGSIGFGNLNGPSTFLTLDAAPVDSGDSDIRDWRIHEVTSRELSVVGVLEGPTGPLESGSDALFFYGTAGEAKALAGRRLLLQHDDGRLAALTCTNTEGDFAPEAGAAGEARMWPLSFDGVPPFLHEDFDEAAPRVTVHGNLAEATQGKAQREAVLGNGDAREAFQTFKLPKAPLTYLLSAGATPPQVPQLSIYVNGREWTRVASFFGRGAKEEIYIVREDAEGASWVQFGDGESGARLPSGIGNVTALYRSGSGAYGALKPGAAPSAGQRLEGLDKVRLPGEASGGAQPEQADKARTAAPGKVQSLGRLVSLQDYETEVNSIPGVTAATATWGLKNGVPAVLLRVLLEAGRETEFEAVRATIAHFQRCRGPDRHPVAIEQALLRYLFLDVAYAADARLMKSDVEARLRDALSALFGPRNRRLGAPEYASRIEGVLQQVTGVQWCRVSALGMFDAGTMQPSALSLPPSPRPLAKKLVCGQAELLQLDPRHLTLGAAAPAPAGECA